MSEKSGCRVCNTCVHGCPAKAIRIAHGRADMLPERCVGCDNCVRAYRESGFAHEIEHPPRRARFDLLTVLAHELKSPLAAIEGYLVNIRDGVVGDAQALQRAVGRSLVRVQGMRQLILDLLDMARVEAGGTSERKLTLVNLVEVARCGIESIAPLALARGIRVEMSAPRLELMAVRREMEIVLNNLISNAVKYNRENGQVELILKRSGDVVEIAVKDTGIGLSPEECSKLFQDFSRIRNPRTRGIEGSGLGLSTVKKIAALYDGSVTVSSEPERGSTFFVTLRSPETSNLGFSHE